jgi:hypothetical protein
MTAVQEGPIERLPLAGASVPDCGLIEIPCQPGGKLHASWAPAVP